MIFGWPHTVDPQHILEELDAWLATIPIDFHRMLLKPYAPRRKGDIAKVKVEPGAMAKVSWELTQRLQEHGREPGRKGPTWSATERSPEQGARRRCIKRGAEVSSDNCKGVLFCEESHGDITNPAGMVLARMNKSSSGWTTSHAWSECATSKNLDWNNTHDNMMQD